MKNIDFTEVKYGVITDFIHSLISMSYSQVKDNLCIVDATAGNGYDTLFLSKLNNSFVYSFDIQKIAVEKTHAIMKEHNRDNYKIILDGHEHINRYVEEDIDIAVFNLGYLPNGDKNLHTRSDTTIMAVDSILEKLSERGRIYIAAYLGHDDSKEANEVLDHISHLDRKKYNVMQIKLINKNNTPPEIYIVESK